MESWIEKIRTRYNFIALACVFAVLAITSNSYFDILVARLGVGANFATLLPHLFADGALIFVAAELVERTLLSRFNREANERNDYLNRAANERIDKLGATLSEKVENVLLLSLDDAKYAAHYHIHFRPPRRSARNTEVSYLEIASAIQDAEWIKIFCTSGRDIFSNERKVVNSLSTRAQKPIEITVLSCEPANVDSSNRTYAKVRGEFEEPNFPNIISLDVGVALDDFRKLFIQANQQESHFRWYYYDFVPQGWFFLTDKIGFAEVYHFSLDIRRRGLPSSCMGGRVPLLSFSPSSGLYEGLKEYLSYLSGDAFKDNVAAQRDRTEFFKIREAYNSRIVQTPEATSNVSVLS